MAVLQRPVFGWEGLIAGDEARHGDPLPFEDIANTPGITEMALHAWMTSTHPTMPDIMLEAEELRGVVAYILI